MDKTMCELFAGVGGFRLGLERLNSGWKTTWFSQWEPGKQQQWAHDCYVKHFGDLPDLAGNYTTGLDIGKVDKSMIPDHNLLVGGFPCQDYSVAHSLTTSEGIQGKKGVLWWQIRDTIIAKNPPFCLFENVDRLLKSPARQRGRDFGIILACLSELGYDVEWRVVNAAVYGAAQRRRRTFIFAYRRDTEYAKTEATYSALEVINTNGFFAKSFPIEPAEKLYQTEIGEDIVAISDAFKFEFSNSGYVRRGIVYTTDIVENSEVPTLLGSILQKNVEEKYYIPSDKLDKWVYMKGAKKIPRKSANGHEYVFSEGPIAFPDSWDKPSRTMLTSESTLNRSTHVVADPGTGRLRLLTPVEAERLQGFDDEWTNTGMPERFRYFCMGNALVVPMITRMGKVLDEIVNNEESLCKGEGTVTDHVYEKTELSNRLDRVIGKTLEEIDDKGIFESVRNLKSQRGIIGTVIERCILKYDSDIRQEADLLIIDDGKKIKTELKSTGMVIENSPKKHYVAKEPMTITAVGIYDISEQEFSTSHFWNKLEHMLLIYYHYFFIRDGRVTPYEYRQFPVKGYEFHEFTDDEKKTLEKDWKKVYTLINQIVLQHPGEKNKEWKEAIKNEYVNQHRQLRNELSFIDLAPVFPPRFRLKKSVVSSIIGKHFGYALEQLPGKYTSVLDIDAKCKELKTLYAGKSMNELANKFDISVKAISGREKKGLAEQITVAMFGGKSKKLNQIEIFEKLGIVAKTVTFSAMGGRTEDMKLFRIDFNEISRATIEDEDGERPFQFEDSELYTYFSECVLLCILYKEPLETKGKGGQLSENIFCGFKRIYFSREFINGPVRYLWDDLRDKVLNKTLVDVPQYNRDGSPRILNSGEGSSVPNFLKSSENSVFVRGSGRNSSQENKTECVNGIRMLPQYVWIKGTVIVDELGKTAEI